MTAALPPAPLLLSLRPTEPTLYSPSPARESPEKPPPPEKERMPEKEPEALRGLQTPPTQRTHRQCEGFG